MACSCSKKSSATKSFTVLYQNGKVYKTYSSEVEAKAAVKRIGGKLK